AEDEAASPTKAAVILHPAGGPASQPCGALGILSFQRLPCAAVATETVTGSRLARRHHHPGAPLLFSGKAAPWPPPPAAWPGAALPVPAPPRWRRTGAASA